MKYECLACGNVTRSQQKCCEFCGEAIWEPIEEEDERDISQGSTGNTGEKE